MSDKKTSDIITSIDIAASPARVWAVLTDFRSYASWNPFVTAVSGTLAVGERLTVRLMTPGKPPVTVKPVVEALEPECLLVWRGFAIVPGFFDGEHRFMLERLDGNGCRLIHSESFEGVLVPLVAPLLLAATREGFISMNKALKQRAESDIPPLV